MAQISSRYNLTSIDQLISTYSERIRLPVKSLEAKKSTLTKKSAVLTDLKSSLKNLKIRTKSFTDIGSYAKLQSKSVVSSDDSIFTVEADATASRGVNTLSISKIARNDLGITDEFNKNSKSLATKIEGSNQFTIKVGSGTETTITVTAGAGDDNETILNSITESINSLVEGATAKVITSGSNKARLSIVSDEEGSESAVTLTSVGESDILEELGFVGNKEDERTEFSSNKGGFITENTADLDAEIAINGIDIISSTNTIDDAIQGVTINLRKAQESGAAAETFTVGIDTDEVKTQVEGFIKDYNETLEYITSKTKIDYSSSTRGELAGDYTFTKLRLDLRSIVSTPVEGVEEGNPALITEIGIAIGNDGSLSLDDEDELEEAILADADAVTDIFSSTNGVATELTEIVEKFTNTGATIDKNLSTITQQSETVEKQITQFESRAKLTESGLRRKYTELQSTLALLNSQQTLLQRLGFTSYYPTSFSIPSASRGSQFGIGS